MDDECNDARCPLNRRGVPHRQHDAIERDAVVDSCNDARCPLTRLGMPHNSHGPMEEPPAGRGSSGGTGGSGFAGHGPGGNAGESASAGRRPGGEGARGGGNDRGGHAHFAGGGGGAQPHGSTTPLGILNEAARYLRQGGAAGKPRQADRASEAERILRASDPHDILGIPRGATIEQVRSCYKRLVKRHDAARGIIHKSAPEKEKSNLIMAKINDAFEALKKLYAAPA